MVPDTASLKVPVVPDTAPLKVPVVPVKPEGKFGAPLPALLVKLSALILPPAPTSGVTPSVDSPKISGIKSSPSAIIRSLFSSTAISAYCVYATFEDDGASIVIVAAILNTVSV